MDIDDFFGNFYQLHSVEGIDRYCRHMEYGPNKRDRILDSEQYVYIRESCCGADYHLLEQVGMFRYQNSYRARPSYRELSLSNGWCKSSLQIVGNKIIHIQNGRRQIETVREFYPDRLRITITVDKSVILVKNYKRVEPQFNFR